jgi:hypothetical protein
MEQDRLNTVTVNRLETGLQDSPIGSVIHDPRIERSEDSGIDRFKDQGFTISDQGLVIRWFTTSSSSAPAPRG